MAGRLLRQARQAEVDQQQGLLGQPTAIELRRRRRRLGAGVDRRRIGGLGFGVLVVGFRIGACGDWRPPSNRQHSRQTQQAGNHQHGHATPKRSRQRRQERLAGNDFRQLERRKARRNNGRCRRLGAGADSGATERRVRSAAATCRLARQRRRNASQHCRADREAGPAAVPPPVSRWRFRGQPATPATDSRIAVLRWGAAVSRPTIVAAGSLATGRRRSGGSSGRTHPSGGEIKTMLPHLGHSRISPMASLFRTASRARHVVQETENSAFSTVPPHPARADRLP